MRADPQKPLFRLLRVTGRKIEQVIANIRKERIVPRLVNLLGSRPRID